MKKETLSEAIGGVDERLIEAAEGKHRAARRWTRWAALAACLALVVTCAALFPHMGGNSSEQGNPSEGMFDLYSGPILPLAGEGGDVLTVSRDVVLDFSGGASRAEVLDHYTLYNPSEETVTVTLRYPFAGTLRELEEQCPVVTVDGQAVDAERYAGRDASGNEPDGLDLVRLNSWEDYVQLLADGAYLDAASGEHADLSDVPVIVYRFDGARAETAGGKSVNPTIRAEFTLDYEKTVVLSYGFHGGRYDQEAGEMGRSFSIGREGDLAYGTSRYLLVLGEDIEGLTTRGYVTGGWDTEETIEASVDVVRYESDLDTVLRQLFDQMYREWSDAEDWAGNSDQEMWYTLYCDDLRDHGLLSEKVANRYQEGMLEDLSFALVDRVFYLELTITIPAGDRTELLFSMEKEGSCQLPGGSRDAEPWTYGYDLAVQLGSDLSFEHQTVRLINTDGIRLEEQSFGFALENGVTEVELEPETERCSLVVLDR